MGQTYRRCQSIFYDLCPKQELSRSSGCFVENCFQVGEWHIELTIKLGVTIPFVHILPQNLPAACWL